MVGSVKNGELHGTSYSYDENGKLKEEIICELFTTKVESFIR